MPDPSHRAGARDRIGIIQPAPGVMLEAEWPAYLPAGTLFPVARVRLTSATAQGYDAVARLAPEAARDLASAGAGVVAYACTVGSLYAGREAEAELITALESASGLRAISLADTCIRAFRKLGVRRPALLTPYDATTNDRVISYARSCGYEIAAARTTSADIATIGDLDGPAIAALSVEVFAAAPGADALWLPCTAMRTLDAIPYIEAISGLPVVSGSQALLWRALDILKLNPSRTSGRLFG